MERNKKVLVVLSGGMDSAVLLLKLINEGYYCQAVNFQYGSKHNSSELAKAKELCLAYSVPLKVIELPLDEHFKSDLLKSGGPIPEGHYAHESMKATVVPFRNGIMLAVAAGYAESIGADSIALGNHFGDHAVYPDCRKDFTDAMTVAIANGTYNNVYLMSPFVEMTKTEVCALGASMHLDYSMTWSCYKGGEIHCGKCGTCNERIEAFKDSNTPDPTVYEV